MKKKYIDFFEGEINFIDLLIKCWKEKILILFTCVICVILSYLYVNALPQEFKAEITIKDPNEEIFNTNYSRRDTEKILKQFKFDFNLNLLSLDNLERFLEQSTDFNDFKEYLKKKKITSKQYFQNNKFGQFKEKNQIITNKFFLIFPKELDGSTFLNNYVEFIKNKQTIELENKLKLSIKLDIEVLQEALVLAKQVNLENPMLNIVELNSLIDNNPEFLFYKGIKMLTYQITFLKKKLSNLENNRLNYNPILDRATVASPVLKSSFLYSIIGLIFGLCLSLVIIFLKAINKN